ncbi:MAG: hypothetical protein M1839_008942 [Geoglossum umbratile]|nr:MAG: hypothetical protein M1839_008942 [Geoglossum umbratile]
MGDSDGNLSSAGLGLQDFASWLLGSRHHYVALRLLGALTFHLLRNGAAEARDESDYSSHGVQSIGGKERQKMRGKVHTRKARKARKQRLAGAAPTSLSHKGAG